jgi:Piwi domain
MIYPASQVLSRPSYVFSDDGKNTHTDKFRGILRYKPLHLPRITEPRCLFIFDEADRDEANRLYLAFHKGIGSFPGMRQFIGVTVGRDKLLDALRLPSNTFHGAGKKLYDVVTKFLNDSIQKPDFVYIIGEQRWKYQHPSPYSAIKAALIPFGLPSQMVSKDLLRVENQWQYAVPNVALASLVKLGGIPWLIQRPDSNPAMVLGIGTTLIPETSTSPKKRFLGFAFCMLSNGLFLDLSFIGAAATYDEFLPSLRLGLRETLVRLGTDGRKVSRLTVHVSHFERWKTIQTINEVLDESRGNSQLSIPFEVLRLTHDSPFMVIDPQHPGYVSTEGTVVHLGDNHALIVTEGRQEQAKWRNRKPVTLEVHREHAYPDTMSFEESLNDTFKLCFVNWRAFSTMSVPVSLAYAKMLSDRIAELSLIQPNIVEQLQQQLPLSKSLWFL